MKKILILSILFGMLGLGSSSLACKFGDPITKAMSFGSYFTL